MQILLLSHCLSDQTTMKASMRGSRCLVKRQAFAIAESADIADRAVEIGRASLGCK